MKMYFSIVLLPIKQNVQLNKMETHFNLIKSDQFYISNFPAFSCQYPVYSCIEHKYDERLNIQFVHRV